MDYWDLYKDVWNFHKKYSKVQPDDVYWEAVTKEASALYQKYFDSKFAKTLVMAVLEELERKAKEMRANADRDV